MRTIHTLKIAVCAMALAASAGAEELGPSFRYDLGDLRKTDPKLVLFDEAKAIDPGISELSAIAVAGPDRILVAGDKALVALRNDGTTVARVALDAPASCLAVDGNGLAYLGVKDHIEVLDADGKRIGVWAAVPGQPLLTSIAAGSNDVYLADAGNQVVWHYDKAGKLQSKIDGRQTPKQGKGFIIPSPHFDVAFGPDGALWVVDPGRHLVRRYGQDGAVQTTWGKTAMTIEGFCGCCNPTDIAIDGAGNFYTSEKGLVRVKMYGPDGAFLGVVAGPEQFAEDDTGLDLAVDSLGRLLVLDPKAGKLRVFVKKGDRK